ncbi:helix-turn-helix domain-containing protein [Commensalibacter melissae]|uniref:helix-turn-helix domain-containing protein n=1 Tax=Commensalibacter melissae TaxID=2070537 RepID=UPI000EFB5898|nr:helix-turn-helix transcriptional regulator [Commensalibacter melissae]AYN86267.1 XRE family transcriptional regulator [Commensalibacter melissae]MUG77228.1 helix-turn-helix domain-containing protein [Commensalibacter melissae]
MKKTIGDKIRKIRRESGLKQVEFVAALDIDRSYLSKIESNRIKPGRDLLIKIAKEFNVSLDWLITDTDDTSTPKNNDEALLLYAFRNMPKDEAKMHLQLMLQRVENDIKK